MKRERIEHGDKTDEDEVLMRTAVYTCMLQYVRAWLGRWPCSKAEIEYRVKARKICGYYIMYMISIYRGCDFKLGSHAQTSQNYGTSLVIVNTVSREEHTCAPAEVVKCAGLSWVAPEKKSRSSGGRLAVTERRHNTGTRAETRDMRLQRSHCMYTHTGITVHVHDCVPYM